MYPWATAKYQSTFLRSQFLMYTWFGLEGGMCEPTSDYLTPMIQSKFRYVTAKYQSTFQSVTLQSMSFQSMYRWATAKYQSTYP